jgi:hypothetical protein
MFAGDDPRFKLPLSKVSAEASHPKKAVNGAS